MALTHAESSKYLSQWTTEKEKAESVNVLPKANVEGAILEDYKIALTLNDGQKGKQLFQYM
jgi:hypothetical protein